MAWFPLQAWVLLPNGKRMEVDDRGLVAGRGPGADLVCTEDESVRRLALVCLEMGGPVIIPLMPNGVVINGVPVADRRDLVAGDRVDIGDLEVRIETRSRARNVPSGWILRHARAFVQVPQGPFSVGGAPEDDLRVADWPPAMMRLHYRHGGLFLEAPLGTQHNGAPIDPGTPVHLSTGDRVRLRDETFQLLEVASSTNVGGRDEYLPTKVVIQSLPPVGGQITVGFPQEESTVFLPKTEFEMVQVLLIPPGTWNPGDPIPDTAIVPRVFGGQAPDATAFTKLVMRLRHSLDRGGLDGPTILTRAGGQVAFRLAHNAAVLAKPSR